MKDLGAITPIISHQVDFNPEYNHTVAFTQILHHQPDYILLTSANLDLLINALLRKKEDTLLTLIMMWVHEKGDRYLPDILPSLNLAKITPLILIDVIPMLMRDITDERVKELLRERYIRALEDKNYYIRENFVQEL